MSHEDAALTISNPRLLAAVYFALLAVIVTCVIDSFLYFMGAEFLPLFKATLLAVVVASCFGALFGKRIIHSTRPYRRKAFLFGFLMVLAALPFYDLGFLLLAQEPVFTKQPLTNYLFTLLYSFIVAGLWLAIAAGFAAMYLRGHLVYDLLHSKYLRRQSPLKKGP